MKTENNLTKGNIIYGVLDSKGRLLSDFRSRVGFTTKQRATEVSKNCGGKVVKLKITII